MAEPPRRLTKGRLRAQGLDVFTFAGIPTRPYQTIGVGPEIWPTDSGELLDLHATRTPNLQTRHTKDLDEFHQDLRMAHGGTTCASCHDTVNDALRLADGRQLPYEKSMQLCAQCHGTQMRDWRRGALAEWLGTGI